MPTSAAAESMDGGSYRQKPDRLRKIPAFVEMTNGNAPDGLEP